MLRFRRLGFGVAIGGAVAGLGLTGLVAAAAHASASTTIDIRGSWSEVTTTQGATYPQTVTFVTENFSTGAVTGTDVGNGQSLTVTGTIKGSTLTTRSVEAGYTSDAVGTISKSGNTLAWNGTFTDSVGHPNGTFTATLTAPAAGGGTGTNGSSGLGPEPAPCTANSPPGSLCTYNSSDGALTFTPAAVEARRHDRRENGLTGGRRQQLELERTDGAHPRKLRAERRHVHLPRHGVHRERQELAT